MTAAVTAVVFAALYAGHMVGDHVIQTDRQAAGKAQTAGWLRPMLGHLAGYHLTIGVALAGLTLVGVPLSWRHVTAALLWSVVTHGVLDRRWPVRWLLQHTGSADFADRQTPICGPYLADQALHVGCLFVAALIVGAGAL